MFPLTYQAVRRPAVVAAPNGQSADARCSSRAEEEEHSAGASAEGHRSRTLVEEEDLQTVGNHPSDRRCGRLQKIENDV